MDRATSTKKRPNFYICLGLILLLTFVSITLLLAKGLDSNRFFGGVTWMLVGLPISLTIPLFVGFDFFEHTYHPDDAIVFCPIAPKGSENLRKFAFLLGIVGTLAAIVLFFVYNGNEEVEPMKASLVFLIPVLPALLLYVGPMIPICFKENNGKDGMVLSLILAAAILATGLLAYGSTKGETTYLLSYIVFPLCAVMLMLYKRED